MGLSDNSARNRIHHDGTEKFEIKLALLYMQIYDDRIVTTSGNTVRTIPFSQITGIWIVATGNYTWWYMEIDYPGVPKGVQDITKFEFHPQYNDTMIEVKNYIQKRIVEINVQNEMGGVSTADELLKLKQLLDMGVITEGEFEEQKRRLLG